MKKLFLFLLILMAGAPMLFGQEPADTTAIPVPGSIMDIFTDLNGWFASTTAVAGLTIFFTLMVGKLWKGMTAIWKQAIALAIALILMTLGNIFNFGFMAKFDVLTTIVYGLVTGFTANGLYDLRNVTPKTK